MALADSDVGICAHSCTCRGIVSRGMQQNFLEILNDAIDECCTKPMVSSKNPFDVPMYIETHHSFML